MVPNFDNCYDRVFSYIRDASIIFALSFFSDLLGICQVYCRNFCNNLILDVFALHLTKFVFNISVTSAYVAVIFRYSCLPLFPWRGIGQRFLSPETIIPCFLHLMVLFFKGTVNHAQTNQVHKRFSTLLEIVKNKY